jgi:multidrug efflux pump subunit AcrB
LIGDIVAPIFEYGIILLIGIVKKSGIMLVDFAQQVEHSEGLTAEESIYQACVLRFRPMVAMLGGVPMIVGTGVGSEIRQPLGYAIVGGLTLSQVLTFYTTPVVYIYLDKLQTLPFGENRKQTASGGTEPQPAE